MIILTAKVKIIFLFIVSAIILYLVYWFVFRVRRSFITGSLQTFSVPSNRVHKVVLQNGMHVLIFQNNSLPKVLVQIAYDVGSYVEETGERGLAHLVEHMIFKGTTALSESDLDTIARKYGASFNAFTSLDVTSYYFETNKNNWKPFISLLADCMQNVRFDKNHLASEVKAVIQELKMGKDNYWRTMILKACELIFPPNHPYHTPTIGFKEDLLTLDSENLKNFYQKYYRPDRATLFVVGDVNPEDVITLAKEQFEHIKPEANSVIKQFPTILPELVTHHTRYFEDVAHHHLGLYWVIPGMKSDTDIVASVASDLLGSGQASYLYRLLVDEKKVAASVYVKATKFMEAGIFLILIEPLPDKGNECVSLVAQELTRIIHDGVAQQNLDSIAKQKSKAFFHKMQDFTSFVYSWIESYFSTRNELALFDRINDFYKVDSAQVQKFIKDFLDPFLMNRIEVMPLPESKKTLRDSIRKMSDDLDKKILAKHIRTTPVEEPKSAQTYPLPKPLVVSFPKPSAMYQLTNRLRVLLLQNNHAPLVTINIQFKDASFLEHARDGIALECMMDMLMEGSAGYTKKDNVDYFEQCGASYSFDRSGARFVCLKEDVFKLLERFNHILRNPTFPENELEKVKKMYVDNYQRAKDSPKAIATRVLRNMVYKGHSFYWTFDEAIDIVNNLNAASLHALHDKMLGSENVIMSVVGDFDSDALQAVIESSFVTWPHGTKNIWTTSINTFSKGMSIDHYMMRDQVMFMLGQPSSITIYDPDLVPLKLLNVIVFGSMGSRIFKVREQTGLFYTAFGGFAASTSREHGFDFVGMLVSPENVATAETVTKELLLEVAKGGVTADELASAQQIYLKDLIDLISDNTSIAQLLCFLDDLELGFDYYDKVLARMQAMDVSELNAIASRYITTKNLGRVRVGPIGRE